MEFQEIGREDTAGTGGKRVVRYSNAFKLQVVSEIEKGEFTVSSANRHYGIQGTNTIKGWLRKLGKDHLMPKVVRVESPQERDQVLALQAKVRELESALAKTQVRLLAYESLVEVAEEYTGLDFKKNFGHKVSSAQKDEKGKIV